MIEFLMKIGFQLFLDDSKDLTSIVIMLMIILTFSWSGFTAKRFLAFNVS